MKHILTISLITLSIFYSYSQLGSYSYEDYLYYDDARLTYFEFDSVEINGEQYYVYPYGATVRSNFYREIKTKKLSLKEQYNNIFKYDSTYSASFKEFKKQMKYYKQLEKGYTYEGLEKPSKKAKKYNEKLFQEMPELYMSYNYTLDSDITPSLDPLPDGKYIQYYNPVELYKDDNYYYDTTLIAGFFSLKNNALDGYAYWQTIDGDTLKSGEFAEGSKNGEWNLRSFEPGIYVFDKNDYEYAKNVGTSDAYNSVLNQTYALGLLNGPISYYSYGMLMKKGAYKKGEKIGTWKIYDFSMDTGENYVRSEKTYMDKAKKHHKPIIRENISFYSFEGDWKDSVLYYPTFSIGTFINIAYEREENLGYDEEQEYIYDRGMENEYMIDYGLEEYFGEVGSTYLSFAKKTDSIGYRSIFTGPVISTYPNGQTMFKYEFVDGELIEESDIYWDNGNVLSHIGFLADSNQYEHLQYDYYGELIRHTIYDSVGYFVKNNLNKKIEKESIQFEDYTLYKSNYSDDFTLNYYDTLAFELKETLPLYVFVRGVDTTLSYKSIYNPNTRVLNANSYSISGAKLFNSEVTFGENYEFMNAEVTYTNGELSRKTISNGSLRESIFYKPDTIPQRYVSTYGRRFDIDEDSELYANGKLFTGEVSIEFDGKKDKRKVKDNEIKISRTIDKNYNKKIYKSYEKYLETKNPKYLKGFEYKYNVNPNSDPSYAVASQVGYLFTGLDGYIELPSDYDLSPVSYEIDYGNSSFKTKTKKWKDLTTLFTARVEGNVLNGKLEGTWKTFDQFGDVLYELNYVKGELTGIVKRYDKAFPKKPAENIFEYDYAPIVKDSFPEKITNYVSEKSEYKNGKLNGVKTTYNWLGEETSQYTFKDNYEEGNAFEKSGFAFTKYQFKDGNLDGLVQTYLTLPKKDSVLLYDLNFQNGMLQGETKVYHTNGQLAKRGFFLTGEPIEDYTSYDTLGKLYHYVKFKFGFAVEEKIWEENELSVKYDFKWQDSIPFEPTEFTNTSSLERMLSAAGLDVYGNKQYYFGRQRMIAKQGLEYYLTKYYPDNTLAREGAIVSGKKTGCWKYYNYDGKLMYEVDYFDSIVELNDTTKFKSKGIRTDFDADYGIESRSMIIEKYEKYDCANTDHYEIRQFITIQDNTEEKKRSNGYVMNYYDSGVLQSEGHMKDGVPTGVWKFYDPYGKINQVGEYVLGKRHGRWLKGDLSKTKYLGDICLNPNLPDIEETMRYKEKQLDIQIKHYVHGKSAGSEYYDLNLNLLEEDVIAD